MTCTHRNLGLALLCLSVLSACGSPGEPLPPSLELARPVRDLRAVRKGNTVTLTWTAPAVTTDRQNIRHPGPVLVCRSTTEMQKCGSAIATLPSVKTREQETTRSYRDTLSNFSTTQNAEFVYAVETLNSYGKSAGLSNQVEVPAAPTLQAPSELKAELSGDGVHLSWTRAAKVPESPGVQFIYRVYRREGGTNAQAIAGEVAIREDGAPSFVDSSIEWEKTYSYRVTGVTMIGQSHSSELQVEGDDSPEITVVAHDVFPPATPSGLQAVFGGPGQKVFIDLIWAPALDADLGGYNVYRSDGEMEAQKLNSSPVQAPAFRDDTVLLGHVYKYSVSAVDVRGNESPRSEATEEKVP